MSPLHKGTWNNFAPNSSHLDTKKVAAMQEFSFGKRGKTPHQALPDRKWTSPAVFLDWWIGLNVLGNVGYFLCFNRRTSHKIQLCVYPKNLKFRLKAIRAHLCWWCTHHGVGSASQEHILGRISKYLCKSYPSSGSSSRKSWPQVQITFQSGVPEVSFQKSQLESISRQTLP